MEVFKLIQNIMFSVLLLFFAYNVIKDRKPIKMSSKSLTILMFYSIITVIVSFIYMLLILIK